MLTVPLNVLPHIRFDDLSAAKRDAIALGQASRGIKLWLRVRGEARGINAIAQDHPFGYLMTDRLLPDGSQLLVGFGRDAAAIDADDRVAVQSALDRLIPGLEVVDATTHDWLADEFARGTWAIHRRGGTRAITPPCEDPRAGSCSRARISPTAGAGSSTARSSPACARRTRCRRSCGPEAWHDLAGDRRPSLPRTSVVATPSTGSTHDIDLWVASASADGAPYLVPLSFDWDGEALLLSTPTRSPTGRNLAAGRTARLGLGDTRDVSMIEGEVEVIEIDALPKEQGDRFAARTGFDPRATAGRTAGSASPRAASRPGARSTSCPTAS